jgi:hypothetical protein
MFTYEYSQNRKERQEISAVKKMIPLKVIAGKSKCKYDFVFSVERRTQSLYTSY